jgi:ABC-type multidrug transport system fused ATPase/permease subunit
MSRQAQSIADRRSRAPRKGDLGLLRRFFVYMKPYKVPLRNVYILYFINSFMNLIPGLSTRYIVDLIIAPEAARAGGKEVTLFGFALPDTRPYVETPGEKVFWLLASLLAVTAVIVLANTVGVFMWRMGTRVTQRLLLDIKAHIVHHLHKLSMSYFHREQTGSIMTRAVNDVMQMQQMLQQSFSLSYGMLHLIVAPIFMISLSPVLFLFCLLPLPVIVYTLRRIRSRLRPLYRQQRERQAEVSAAMQEQISGIREIKAFGQEDQAKEDISRVNVAYMQSVNDAMRIFSVNHQVMYGTNDFSMVLLVVGGGILIATGVGNVTLGMVLGFLPLMHHFFNPFRQLVGFYDVIQRGLASTERVIEFFDTQPDIEDAPGARWVNIDQGRVTFENVTFAYEQGQDVLHDVNLDVEPGQTVAIVGSTGSGKSTLVSLIPRFYEPRNGRILIDGHPLDEVKMDCLRNAIGIVFQETFLFYGTIAQNIAFSRPSASPEEIVQAARLANIHDFIMSLPDKYEARIGERGVTLSGGQRQRLAIARMILKDPRVIILDEATSALDTTTERLIQESMDRLMAGRTSFVIAHRLSTIRAADRIVVMENGQILETGPHDELIHNGGRYAELVAAVE